MKSFASVALLALSAFALDIEDAFSNVKYSDDGKAHRHDHPVVHVNVWDTIDAELMELMTEITALETQVNANRDMINTANESFSTFMDNVNTLQTTNQSNNNNLATQKAIDASQDRRLSQLVDDITALEHKVADLENKTEILRI